MKKANKKISVIVSMLLMVTMLFSTGSVWAKENIDLDIIQTLHSEYDISSFAIRNEVNIVIYDTQNNISSEFHLDGLRVEYVVDPLYRSISEIRNSEGIGRQIKKTIDDNEKAEIRNMIYEWKDTKFVLK